jgi:hypothetical protein
MSLDKLLIPMNWYPVEMKVVEFFFKYTKLLDLCFDLIGDFFKFVTVVIVFITGTVLDEEVTSLVA